MINFAPFDTHQVEYIKRSQNSWLNVAEGGKRAGKNIMNVVAWAAAIEDSDDVLHLAAGVSQAAARMNIIDSDGMGLEHIFEGRCKYGQDNGRDALLIDTRKGKKAVIIAGGGDSRSASLIKGNSYSTIYIFGKREVPATPLSRIARVVTLFRPPTAATLPVTRFRLASTMSATGLRAPSRPTPAAAALLRRARCN